MKKIGLATLAGCIIVAGVIAGLAWSGDRSLLITALLTALLVCGLLLMITPTMMFVRKIFWRVKKLQNRKALQPSSAKEIASYESETSSDLPLMSSTRERFINSFLVQTAMELPSSNGSRHYTKIPLTVGIITDEYMFNFYRDVFEKTVYLSPSNFQRELSSHEFDAVLFVTCWRGMYDDEWRGMSFRERPKAALEAIIGHCKANEVPLVFQSIEDPSNFDHFLDLAKQFDYVFTSDSDCVDRYKSELGHDNVYYGEYGANPIVNNPVGSQRHNFQSVFFAGSYPERYPERTKDMETMFDSVLANPRTDTPLLIVDRNYGSGSFEFPDRFRPYTIGPFSHEVLQRIHKLFAYSANFNSIKSSPTMCAMRVYELQAQGKPMLTNYAMSVFNKFPNLKIVPFETDLAGIFSEDSLHDADVMAQQSLNDIMTARNSFEIAGKMMETIGLSGATARPSKILVIVNSDDPDFLEVVRSQKDVDVEIAFDGDSYSDLAEFGYVARMSNKHDYSPTYLIGRLNAFKYTDVDFVTQLAHYDAHNFIPGPVHEFTSYADKVDFTMAATDSDESVNFVLSGQGSLQGNGYAVDPYQVNYWKYREQRNKASESTREPKLSVIVPVYNNGAYLEAKAIASLKANRLWSEMEILLVDDGSTDTETINTCNRLVRTYPHISLYSFNDGGSGSASRPRNKGIELATAPLVTFLDPDNEISTGGYDTLVSHLTAQESQGAPVDFVSGFQVKVAATAGTTGLHARDSVRIVDDSKAEFFERGKFPVVSTQAAVIKKSLLLDNDITFVESAAGQDTLFGWEVLLHAERAAFVDDAYLIYYAERADSVTNEVSVRFFEKFLINEREQVAVLRSHDLLDVYKEKHLPNFVRNWYLLKLAQVPESEQVTAKETIEQITALYGHTITDFTD